MAVRWNEARRRGGAGRRARCCPATSRSTATDRRRRAVGGPGRGIAAPGFVDLQVNGFAGVDLMTADHAGYVRVGEALLETGTTAFQPTFVTAPEDALLAALHAMPLDGIGPRVSARISRARSCSPDAAGRARPAPTLAAPDLALLRRLLDAGAGLHRSRGAGAAGRARADRRARRARRHGVGGPHRRDRRRGPRRLRPRHPHGHAPVQRDAPEHARDPGIAWAALARADVIVQVDRRPRPRRARHGAAGLARGRRRASRW